MEEQEDNQTFRLIFIAIGLIAIILMLIND